MDAKELRIRNLIEYNNQDWIISGIASPKPLKDKRFSDKWIVELYDGGLISVALDDCNPIPLTEEWLINFGFKRFTRGVGWDELSNGIVTLTYVPTNKGELIAFRYATDSYGYIKTVHHLQTLYFALTGEELTLKQ